jgi:hypothetical protein
METWVRRTSGDQSLLGEDYFQLAVAFGRGAAVCSTSPPLAISTPPPSRCGRGGKRRLRRRSRRSEEHQLGISRHERQEFRHDEIFRDRDSNLQRYSWSLLEPCSRSNRITTTITTDAGMVTRR